MKKVLFAFVLSMVMCSGCQTFEYCQKVNYLDYTYFKERDFFVTETNTVSFPYESLGSISVVVRSGKVYKQSGDEESYKPIYQRSASFKYATIGDIYKLVYNSVTEKGGNGILGFKIDYLLPNKFSGKNKSNDGYMITGMAIKKYEIK